jgi:hypothetical protein
MNVEMPILLGRRSVGGGDDGQPQFSAVAPTRRGDAREREFRNRRCPSRDHRSRLQRNPGSSRLQPLTDHFSPITGNQGLGGDVGRGLGVG